MAYDQKLEERMREILKGAKGVTSKKMFGGVCFLLDGKMFVGIVKDELMVRVGPEGHNKAVSQKHARPMDFTGKPMVGFIYVAPAGLKGKAALSKWIKWGKDYAATLPAKKKKSSSRTS
ncbi:MAG TPA: TfoX/Sxy family protein [bacterium]|nr:TfoX/Sxy family protein [bacterium]